MSEAEIRPEELSGGTAVAVGRGGHEESTRTEIPASLPVLLWLVRLSHRS